MNKENCALKLVDEIILYYDARSKKTSITEQKGLKLGCHLFYPYLYKILFTNSLYY